MPLQSRIPEICVSASLLTQRAVEETGQHVEFLALQRAQLRRDTGAEMRNIRWLPDKRKVPMHSGIVASGFVTRFHEYGTVFMPPRPIMGPAAEEAEASWLEQMSTVYR